MKEKIFVLLRKNLLYLASLVLSAFLWFYVLSTEALEIEKAARVRIQLPQEYGLEAGMINSVNLTLTGPRAFMRTLEEKELEIQFPVQKREILEDNTVRLEATRGDVPLPFGVTITKVTPEEIFLKLGKLRKKVLPIELTFKGEIGENHRFIKKKITPSRVTVWGVSSILREMKSLPTKPLDVKELFGQTEIPLNLDLKDGYLKLRDNINPRLNYLIRPKKANIQLNNVTIRFLSSRRIKRASDRTASLMVFSEAGEDTKITKNMLTVVADVPEDKKGKVKVKLRAVLPEGVYLHKIQPEEIFVYTD